MKGLSLKNGNPWSSEITTHVQIIFHVAAGGVFSGSVLHSAAYVPTTWEEVCVACVPREEGQPAKAGKKPCVTYF